MTNFTSLFPEGTQGSSNTRRIVRVFTKMPTRSEADDKRIKQLEADLADKDAEIERLKKEYRRPHQLYMTDASGCIDWSVPRSCHELNKKLTEDKIAYLEQGWKAAKCTYFQDKHWNKAELPAKCRVLIKQDKCDPNAGIFCLDIERAIRL